MASVTAAIGRVRRARQQAGAGRDRRFDRYRPAYETALVAVADCGGDPAFDELTGWMIETTKDEGRLPAPAAVRERARGICAARDVEPPADSLLAE